jgi:hypothetical protein
MNESLIIAALGVLGAAASAAFFFLGRGQGRSAVIA